jgi:hypothetical protein
MGYRNSHDALGSRSRRFEHHFRISKETVGDAYHVQLARKERRSTVLTLPFVTRMVLEEIALVFKGGDNRLRLIDVSLSTVDNRNISGKR